MKWRLEIILILCIFKPQYKFPKNDSLFVTKNVNLKNMLIESIPDIHICMIEFLFIRYMKTFNSICTSVNFIDILQLKIIWRINANFYH